MDKYITTSRSTNKNSIYSTVQKNEPTDTPPASQVMMLSLFFVIAVLVVISLIIILLDKVLAYYDSKKQTEKELIECKATKTRKRIYSNQQSKNKQLYEQWHKIPKSIRVELWEQRREDFFKLRRSTEFAMWRKEQYECQNHNCAWCKKYISYKSMSTHVDHVMPLFHGGTNDFSNMVIACESCNVDKKGQQAKGFNDEYIDGKKQNDKFNTTPNWIRLNKYAYNDEQTLQ